MQYYGGGATSHSRKCNTYPSVLDTIRNDEKAEGMNERTGGGGEGGGG